MKRNPRRTSFAKTLKTNSDDEKKPLNGHIKENGESVYSGTIGSNGTTLSIKNENSVKSLDEIMTMDEVGADLIEMKHANGNKFYIEDTKSNNSNTSTYPDFDPALAAAAAANEATMDDEKSVIAMLDDMLQAEDDGGLPTPGILGYDRKISVDSEMLPSVIETTTVATVHSSSDSSEKDLGELTEVEAEHDNTSVDFDMYAESERIANSLVDDVLESVELWNAIEKHFIEEQLREPTSQGEDLNDQKPIENNSKELNENILLEKQYDISDKEILRRTSSEASMLSNNPVEDPMHSDKFKNKLSQIFMRPPVPIMTNTKPKDEKITEGSEDLAHSQLKHSKSETDIRKLVLKAIEGTGVSIGEKDGTENANIAANDGIPKPPKFDPVLYKTLNNLNITRQRPSLNKLLKQDDAPSMDDKRNYTTTTNDDEPTIPFKTKLEAILIRGPSHRSQQRPDVPIRRAKSIGPAARLTALGSLEDSDEDGSNGPKKTKSQNNLSSTPNTVEAINDVRKLLKPVKNGPA